MHDFYGYFVANSVNQRAGNIHCDPKPIFSFGNSLISRHAPKPVKKLHIDFWGFQTRFMHDFYGYFVAKSVNQWAGNIHCDPKAIFLFGNSPAPTVNYDTCLSSVTDSNQKVMHGILRISIGLVFWGNNQRSSNIQCDPKPIFSFGNSAISDKVCMLGLLVDCMAFLAD